MKQLVWVMAVIVLLIALATMGQVNVTATKTALTVSTANLTAQLVNCGLTLIIFTLILSLPLAIAVGWRWRDGQRALDFIRAYKTPTPDSILHAYNSSTIEQTQSNNLTPLTTDQVTRPVIHTRVNRSLYRHRIANQLARRWFR